MQAPDASSTRPYLIRALYEWCTDNGFTPYVAVMVDDSVQVPREFVKNGEIVLNISFDATSSLQLGNDFIEFKARFGGVARDIMVPVSRVAAIFAKENGQGMAFPLESPKLSVTSAPSGRNLSKVDVPATASEPESTVLQLASAESPRQPEGGQVEPEPPRPPAAGARPALKRVK